MENASKALIIAGAIIIAIVLISLGVYVLSGASEMVKGAADMSSTQVQAFNAQFLQYQGDKISGSNAKALCNLIRNNNAQYADDFAKQVTLTFEENDAEDTAPATGKITLNNASINNLRAGNYYKITFGYDSQFNSGRIVVCNIAPAR